MENVIPDQALEAQRRDGRFSLRARLIMLVIASVVPLVAFTLARGYLDYQKGKLRIDGDVSVGPRLGFLKGLI